MSISNATETAILRLVFNATAWANYADNAATTPETNIVMAAQTADPGEAGTMSTSETTYNGYARVNVPRTTGGWTETTGSVSPVATISFPAGTAGATGTLSFASAGKSGGGAAAILWSGTITPNILMNVGVTPQLPVSSTITLD